MVRLVKPEHDTGLERRVLADRADKTTAGTATRRRTLQSGGAAKVAGKKINVRSVDDDNIKTGSCHRRPTHAKNVTLSLNPNGTRPMTRHHVVTYEAHILESARRADKIIRGEKANNPKPSQADAIRCDVMFYVCTTTCHRAIFEARRHYRAFLLLC